MTSRITELESPVRFVDEQVKGPFRHFRHERRFEAKGDATVMTDTIVFDTPFEPLGRVAEVVVLGRYLPRLIAERNAYLKRALLSDPWV